MVLLLKTIMLFPKWEIIQESLISSQQNSPKGLRILTSLRCCTKYHNVNFITKAVLHELIHEGCQVETRRMPLPGAHQGVKEHHDKRGWQVSLNQCQLINFVCDPAPPPTPSLLLPLPTTKHPSLPTSPLTSPLNC